MNALCQLPRRVPVLGGTAVVVTGLVLALNRPGGWSVALLGGLLVVAAWVRPAAEQVPPKSLVLVERQQIGRDAGVALFCVEGQPLLVAYGPWGVQFQRLESRSRGEARHGC